MSLSVQNYFEKNEFYFLVNIEKTYQLKQN